MRLFSAVFLILAPLCISGCASPYVLTNAPRTSAYWESRSVSFDELNSDWKGERVDVVKRDGTVERGEFIHASADHMTWAEYESGAFHDVPMLSVERLDISRNYVWEGAAAGFVGAAGTLVWSGAWAAGTEGMNPPETVYKGRYITVAAGVLGGLVGAGVGSLVRHTNEILIIPATGMVGADSDSTIPAAVYRR